MWGGGGGGGLKMLQIETEIGNCCFPKLNSVSNSKCDPKADEIWPVVKEKEKKKKGGGGGSNNVGH